jgi:xanthine dehydrogenase accessory factor
MDLPLAQEICRHCDADERIALCTIVSARGSTPQSKGAKMLVLADGHTIGTLGGGCVEAEVRKQAIELLLANQSRLTTFKLDHDYGWDDGLICGGVMDVFIQMIDLDRSEAFRNIANALSAKRNTQFIISYEQETLLKKYVEELSPPPMLLIVGAGHVGHALSGIAANLDFRVTVIDDRSDLLLPERFPKATKIVGDIETELQRFPIDLETFVVIVTRGHKHDGQALHTVINSQAKYIGLIGSKRKIKTIFEDLAGKGVAIEKLLNVHAPIGLELGAVSVNEIAVSIAAELVAVRRGRENQSAKPMKIDAEQMRSWLSR